MSEYFTTKHQTSHASLQRCDMTDNTQKRWQRWRALDQSPSCQIRKSKTFMMIQKSKAFHARTDVNQQKWEKYQKEILSPRQSIPLHKLLKSIDSGRTTQYNDNYIYFAGSAVSYICSMYIAMAMGDTFMPNKYDWASWLRLADDIMRDYASSVAKCSSHSTLDLYLSQGQLEVASQRWREAVIGSELQSRVAHRAWIITSLLVIQKVPSEGS